MDKNILYKRRIKKINDFFADTVCDEDIRKTIEEINKTNFISKCELNELLKKDNSIETLKENGINYTIVPDNCYFRFKVIISVSDGILEIPCDPINSEEDWELDINSIKEMNHEDLLKIKFFFESKMEEFKEIVQTGNNELKMLVNEAGGLIIEDV